MRVELELCCRVDELGVYTTMVGYISTIGLGVRFGIGI